MTGLRQPLRRTPIASPYCRDPKGRLSLRPIADLYNWPTHSTNAPPETRRSNLTRNEAQRSITKRQPTWRFVTAAELPCPDLERAGLRLKLRGLFYQYVTKLVIDPPRILRR